MDFSTTVSRLASAQLGVGGAWLRSCDAKVFCVQAGWVLAASYDRSAQLWQRDESVPKVKQTCQQGAVLRPRLVWSASRSLHAGNKVT